MEFVYASLSGLLGLLALEVLNLYQRRSEERHGRRRHEHVVPRSATRRSLSSDRKAA